MAGKSWWRQEHEAADHIYIVKKQSKVGLYCLRAGRGRQSDGCRWSAPFPFYWGEDPNPWDGPAHFRVGLPYSVNPSCKCPHRPTKGVFHPAYKTDYFVKIFSFYVICTHTTACVVMHKNLDSTYEIKCIFMGFPFSVVFLTYWSPYSTISCRWYNFIPYNKVNIHCMYITFSLPVCMLMDIYTLFFSTTAVDAQPSLCCVWLCSIRNTPSNETARY